VPRITPEQALIRIYQQAANRLRVQVRQALAAGNIGTAAYQAAQLRKVQQTLAALGHRTRPLAAAVVTAPYTAGAHAVDAAFGQAGVAFGFTGTDRRAVAVLADNVALRLGDARDLVGRRVDDAFRRVALEQVAQGVAAGATRREVSAAIERRLIDDGVTDALTGFVTSRGARLQLDDYARMVARTTTREAVSVATKNRLLDRGEKLITISDHGTTCEICEPYEGQTYALPGTVVEGYDTIDQLPPFHPNCLHVATPAAGSAERFLASLGVFAAGG
jgi:hypothetical protein